MVNICSRGDELFRYGLIPFASCAKERGRSIYSGLIWICTSFDEEANKVNTVLNTCQIKSAGASSLKCLKCCINGYASGIEQFVNCFDGSPFFHTDQKEKSKLGRHGAIANGSSSVRMLIFNFDFVGINHDGRDRAMIFGSLLFCCEHSIVGCSVASKKLSDAAIVPVVFGSDEEWGESVRIAFVGLSAIFEKKLCHLAISHLRRGIKREALIVCHDTLISIVIEQYFGCSAVIVARCKEECSTVVSCKGAKLSVFCDGIDLCAGVYQLSANIRITVLSCSVQRCKSIGSKRLHIRSILYK